MRLIKKQSGVTLIELTVVLLILVALAGVVVPYIGGTSSAALCKATDLTMQNVKKVIMERYYLDTLGFFPKGTKNSADNYSLKYLFTKPSDAAWQSFDLNSQTGWRGPYLNNGITLCADAHPTYPCNESAIYKVSKLTGTTFENTAYVSNNTAFAAGDIIVLDGWGRPLILQVYPDSSNNLIARLVSAGAGNGVGLVDKYGSLLADIETKITDTTRKGDDRILYLNAPATDVNPSCDEN